MPIPRKYLLLINLAEVEARRDIAVPCRLVSRLDQIYANQAVQRTQDARLDDDHPIKGLRVADCSSACAMAAIRSKMLAAFESCCYRLPLQNQSFEATALLVQSPV